MPTCLICPSHLHAFFPSMKDRNKMQITWTPSLKAIKMLKCKLQNIDITEWTICILFLNYSKSWKCNPYGIVNNSNTQNMTAQRLFKHVSLGISWLPCFCTVGNLFSFWTPGKVFILAKDNVKISPLLTTEVATTTEKTRIAKESIDPNWRLGHETVTVYHTASERVWWDFSDKSKYSENQLRMIQYIVYTD